MAEKRCVFKCIAWNCGSYQFNLYKDEINQGELCDVHYWQTKAQRQWIGLTKEDKFEIAEKLGLVSVEWLNLMRVIEAKLKERNCE